MPKTCCGSGCGCVVTAGPGVDVGGSGSLTDPFVVSANVFEPIDNDTFNITLTGDGETGVPYTIEVEFASTASVKDLPDWSDNVPTNGQVPVWNSTLGLWIPGSNTPAASGSVDHDTSLDGDGSSGDILQVVHDPDRFTETTTDGIGLTDVGINAMVRRFATSADRALADPAETLNAISVLDTAPGKLDYYTGSGHKPVDAVPTVSNGAFLELSGAYTTDTRTRQILKQLAVTTDADGKFTVLGSGDLAGLSGVIGVTVQPSGTVPYAVLVTTQPGYIQGTAYRLDTGAIYPLQPIQALVSAVVY